MVFYLTGDKLPLTYASLTKTARFTYQVDKLQLRASLKKSNAFVNNEYITMEDNVDGKIILIIIIIIIIYFYIRSKKYMFLEF